MIQLRQHIVIISGWNRKSIMIPSVALALSIITIIPVCTPALINKTPTLELPAVKPNIPTPYPPCYGYFVFIVDASNGTRHVEKEIVAIRNVTKLWNLDGSGKLQVAVMATGVPDFPDGVGKSKFCDNREEWEDVLIQLSVATSFANRGPPMSPQNISNVIASLYCNTSIEYSMAGNASITFVIFTSYSDENGISAALNAHRPWLSCPIARHESIFVVAIDDGSPNLNELSYPSRESFVRMTDFSRAEVDYLKNKITLTVCDCKPTSDGRLPQGCPPIIPPRYFAFLVDASNKAVHFQDEIWALSNITEHWNLDGSGEAYVTAADTGLADELLDTMDGFATKRSDWDRIQAHLEMNTVFNRADSPISPTDISKLISSVYCNRSSTNHIGENGNIKFIIFTSYGDVAGIDAALQASKPWLSCPMAKQESIFIVSIDGGSSNLNQLSYPSSGLFMQMNDFNKNEMQQLTMKINSDMYEPKPPTPPPCRGYFTFLVDASNKAKHFQQEIWALSNITEYWKLNGSGEVYVTAADTGLDDENLEYMDGFVTKREDWNRIQTHLSSNTIFNRAESPMSPSDISELISSVYCNRSSTSHIGEHGKIKFIIFTSYSNAAGIDATLKASKPWLPCPMAGQESIFVVSIDDGSTHLKQLSYPTPDLFMQMTDFSQNEMQQLTKEIIQNMCDCQRLPDGTLPAGCVLPSPRPTTPVPITTPKVPIASTTQKPVVPSSTTQKPKAPSSTTQKPKAPSSTTQKPKAPSSTTQKPKAPSSTTQKPNAPSSTTKEPKAPSGTTQEPKAPSSTTQKSESHSSTTQSSQHSATSSAPSLTSSINYIQILAFLILITHF